MAFCKSFTETGRVHPSKLSSIYNSVYILLNQYPEYCPKETSVIFSIIAKPRNQNKSDVQLFGSFNIKHYYSSDLLDGKISPEYSCNLSSSGTTEFDIIDEEFHIYSRRLENSVENRRINCVSLSTVCFRSNSHSRKLSSRQISTVYSMLYSLLVETVRLVGAKIARNRCSKWN